MAQTSIPGVAAAAAAVAGSRAGCVIDGIDINTCTDDFKLNELVSFDFRSAYLFGLNISGKAHFSTRVLG